MEARIAALERKLAEEQRRREEAEQKLAEEQRLRELQGLTDYLESCHKLSLGIQVVTDRTLTTKGDTTNPYGRIYPKRIIPWDDFPSRQAEVWDQLDEHSFSSQPLFPTSHQLDYVQSLSTPISSEQGLRQFEHDTVENAVQKIVDAVTNNAILRERLGLQGTVTFESHTNFWQ